MSDIHNLIGLAKRAGKIQSGEYCTEKSVKSGKAKLVLIAADASAGTRKKFRNMTDFYHVAAVEYSTKEELGSCIGAQLRSCVAVEDEGFAGSMLKKLSENT